MNIIHFILRGARQDWRGTEVRILFLALVVAVASLSAVGFFTDRVAQGMARQASELLGADLVLRSHEPLPPELIARAEDLGLDLVRTVEFRSMLHHDGRMQLSEIKAVSAGYPLRGQLRAQTESGAEERVMNELPGNEQIWVEQRLSRRLGLNPGDTLQVGRSGFKLGAILTHEPDRGGDLFQLAPRLLMSLEQLPRTDLLGPGSRVKHHLLLAGKPSALAAFREHLNHYPQPDWETRTARESRPELRAALSQAERFLGLAAIAAVVLAGAAVAVAARHYARHQADAAAIMRCLGATQGFVTRLYLARMLIFGLLASSVGCLAGYALQGGLAAILSQFFLQALPPPGWSPLLLGYVTGLLTLLAFALPPILRIKSVPPLRVLRNDLGMAPPSLWSMALLALLAMAALIRWQAGDTTLALIMLGGLAVALLLLFATAWLLVRGLRGLREHSHIAWRFGLANLSRRAQASALQLTAFGLGLTALLLLAVVRVDLLDTWQADLPADTPNHFLINIQPGELAALRDYLADAELSAELYPMIPGRLLRVNQRPLKPGDFDSPRGQRLARRAFSLSWHEQMPAHNQVVAGDWGQHPGEVSVEQGIAELFDIELGDQLVFRVAGQEIQAKVSNFRELEWDSFKVNFFFILSPELLRDIPGTYLTSFYLPPDREDWLNGLVERFPGVTALNVMALLGQVREVMEQAARAVEYVFLLTLLSGLLVLYAAIQASQEERLREGAILRTLGASRRQVLATLLAEFITLGALAGLLAALMANLLGYLLATQVFELGYYFNPWLWLLGLVGGAAGVGVAGILGTYRLLRQSPALTLRQVS